MAKKGLRSCLHCGIIQEDKQFKINGCRNECFDADEGKLRLELHTTKNYTGIIAITEPLDLSGEVPRKSWVARFHRIHGVGGCYSLHRVGDRPRLVHGDWEFTELDLIPEEWKNDKMKGIRAIGGAARKGGRAQQFNQANAQRAEAQKAQDEGMYSTGKPEVKVVRPDFGAPKRKKKGADGEEEEFDDMQSEIEQSVDLGEVDDDFEL